MISEKEKLKSIIIRKVYKTSEIRGVSNRENAWIMDFKSVAMEKEFVQLYTNIFWQMINANISDATVQIGGMESGAMPLITAISMTSDDKNKTVNPFYIRKSRKKSDLANQLEGNLTTDIRTVLVDDVMFSGSTFNKQIKILEKENIKVSDIFVIVRYRDQDFYKNLFGDNITVHSIFELDDFTKELNLKNFKKISREIVTDNYSAIWRVSLGKPNLYYVNPKSGPVADSDHIYIGSDDGHMRCLRKSDGVVVWEHKVKFGADNKFIFSTPVISDEYLYFGAYDGNFYCLDKANGKVVWVNFDGDWIGSSPCMSNDGRCVYIGLEYGLFKKRGGVICLDAKTGKKIWDYKNIIGYVHASPAYNAKHNLIVCGSNDKNIYALDAKTGVLKWRYETDGEVKYGAIYDNDKNLVIVASMDGGVYCLSVYDGSLYHRFSAMFGFYSTASLYKCADKNLIIIGSLDKYIYAYNLDTKDIEWRTATSGRIFASPLVIGDTVYIGSNDGKLYELSAISGMIKSTVQMTDRIVNRVIVEANEVYVPLHTCEIIKIAKI